MSTEVIKLIKESSCRADESNYHFNILTGAKGNFNVSDKKMPHFLRRYCELVHEDEENSGNDPKDRYHFLNIAEPLTGKTSPLVSKFFFKFGINKEELDSINLITNEFVQTLVFAYQRAMADLLNISSEMREFTTVVLQTPIWTVKDISYYILELRFPYCVVDKNFQKTKLRAEIISNLRRLNLIANLPVSPNNDWEEIMQPQEDYLPLYRSSAEPSFPIHSLRTIYTVLNDVDDDAQIELAEVFNPRKHRYIREKEIKIKFSENEEENGDDEDDEESDNEEDIDLDKWFPLFLSAHYWNKVTTVKTRKSPETGKVNEYENTEDLDDLSKAKIFLDMINPETIKQDNYWLDIGKALYTISKGSEEGLETFIYYSRSRFENKKNVSPSKIHDKEECKLVWPTLRLNFLTIKTLAWMARKDSPLNYKQWHDSWVNPIANLALDELAELDMAELVYRHFWLDFMCTNIKSSVWWYYTADTHRWVPMDSAFKLMKGINNDIIRVLEQMRHDTQRDKLNLGSSRGNEQTKKTMETKMGQITKLMIKYKTKNTCDRVISFCKNLFYVENFRKMANKGGLCTAWSNCVVEICGNYPVVRPGKPEDFLTKCGAVRYRTDFTWEHPLVKECLQYLGQVFPDKHLLHYAIKDFASYLKGKNAEKIFRVWTGEGNNSKSMLVKLMQLWLGELCIDLPDWVYSGGGRKGGGPSPELAQADSALLAITCEPEEGNDLSAGAIKKGTGGDRFFARMCGDDGGSIDLTHKSVYMCNAIPTIPNLDKATKNRFGILPFLSTWSMDAPDDPIEQYRTRTFKMDPFFERRLPDMAEAIFWIAVEYFPKYMEEGLIPPQIIRDYTNQHWKDNDPYEAFMFEKLKQVKMKPDDKISESNSLTSTDLYPHFKSFFKSQYPQSQVPTGPQFRTQMIQRIGKQVDRRWVGWKVQDAV